MSEPSDEEWLLARERGEDVSHIPAERRAKYDRLGEMIARLPDIAPRAGWEEEVLDKIAGNRGGGGEAPAPAAEARSSAPASYGEATATELPAVTPIPFPPPPKTTGRKIFTWLTSGAFAAAAAVVIAPRLTETSLPPVVARTADRAVRELFDGLPPAYPDESTRFALNWSGDAPTPPLHEQLIAGSIQYRGRTPGTVLSAESDAIIGDTLRVTGRGAGPIELRVYDETRLLARCRDTRLTEHCRVTRTGTGPLRELSLEVKLERIGEVRTVLFLGDTPPPSTDSLDDDIAAAERAGIAYHRGLRVIPVR